MVDVLVNDSLIYKNMFTLSNWFDFRYEKMCKCIPHSLYIYSSHESHKTTLRLVVKDLIRNALRK